MYVLVLLTCFFLQVSWMRGRDMSVLSVGPAAFSSDPRFAIGQEEIIDVGRTTTTTTTTTQKTAIPMTEQRWLLKVNNKWARKQYSVRTVFT